MLTPLAHKSPANLEPFRAWGHVLALASLAILILVFSLFIRGMVREHSEAHAHTSAIASRNERVGHFAAAFEAASQA